MVPFLFRFAQPIPAYLRHLLRYDAQRQISQVLIDGKWVDGPDALAPLIASTRETRVPRETTDDA
jgi:hypothetical protein